MDISVVEGITTVKVSAYQLAMIGIIAYYLGMWARAKLKFLVRFAIPGPVIGGLVFSIIVAIIEGNGIAKISFDNTIQTFLMMLFFCCLGVSASFSLIKKGTVALLVFVLICSLSAVLQNVVGFVISSGFGIDPRYGIVAGSIPFTGGLATSGAFAPLFEEAGVTGALPAAIACATFGIVAGGLVAGPVSQFMIRKGKLRTPLDADYVGEDFSGELLEEGNENTGVTGKVFLKTFALLLVILGIGSMFSYWAGAYFKSIGSSQTFPINLGAMLAGMIVRNIMDGTKKFKIDTRAVDILSNICLGFFISMAVASMKLAQIAALAGPLLTMAFTHLAIAVVLSYFLVYLFFGRNYESTLLSAGYIGLMMGATYNAFASMDAVTSKYGGVAKCMKPYFVISLTGAFFLDIVNAFLINYMGNATWLLRLFS